MRARGAQIGFLRVLSYASLYRYTLNAFVQLQYRGRDDGCGLADDPQYQVGRNAPGRSPGAVVSSGGWHEDIMTASHVSIVHGHAPCGHRLSSSCFCGAGYAVCRPHLPACAV